MGYKLNGAPLIIDAPFKDSNGASYPSTWLRRSTPEERAGVPTGGITWEPDPPWYDKRFYTGKDTPKNIDELKKDWIQIQKDAANEQLSSTDWLVVRKAESGTAIPSDITTYRTAVRTKCKEREDQITACSNTDALAKLINESPMLLGTADNGATELKYEVFNTDKEITWVDKEDGDKVKSYDPKRYESFDPKQYASYDPKRYDNVANPARLKDWPTS